LEVGTTDALADGITSLQILRRGFDESSRLGVV